MENVRPPYVLDFMAGVHNRSNRIMLGCMLIPVLQMQYMADQSRIKKTLIYGFSQG